MRGKIAAVHGDLVRISFKGKKYGRGELDSMYVLNRVAYKNKNNEVVTTPAWKNYIERTKVPSPIMSPMCGGCCIINMQRSKDATALMFVPENAKQAVVYSHKYPDERPYSGDYIPQTMNRN